ncbi:MAG: hypothetical protein ACSHWQ_06795, partial [Spongiibacteraceae bacterium]
SGRRRSPAKGVTGNRSRVRIPSSPPHTATIILFLNNILCEVAPRAYFCAYFQISLNGLANLTLVYIARPRLGRAINNVLGLRSDENDRRWLDHKGSLALESEVWGSWKPDGEGRGGRYQDEGEILWAKRAWLDEVLKTCGQSLVYQVSFSKYKSTKSYDETSGVREIYVGLKRHEQEFRFWFAKKASKTAY